MRKLLRLFVLLPFVFGLFTSVSCFAIETEEVAKIAADGKDVFIAAMMIDYLKEYGPMKCSRELTVSALAELAPALQDAKLTDNTNIELETPFQVHSINPDMILSSVGQEDMSGAIVPTDEWLVPVKICNESVMLLTVSKLNGKWQVVGNSLGGFGKRMQQVPAEFSPQMQISSEFSPQKKKGKYVWVRPAYIDFIAIQENNETKVFLFPEFESHLRMDSKQKDVNGLYRAADVLPDVAHWLLSRANQLN